MIAPMQAPSAVEIDALAADVGERAQARLELLRRAVDAHAEPAPEPASWWSRWLAPRRERRTVALESELEGAQRRALTLRAGADRARAEAAVLGEEVAALERCAAACRALGTAAGDAGAQRLAELLAVERELLGLFARLADALARLARAAEAELRRFDAELPRLAAEAEARDLEAALGGFADDAAVARVNLATRDGRAVVVAAIDRLRDEVALLAPRTRGWLDAEAEAVAARRPVDELLDAWRAERGLT